MLSPDKIGPAIRTLRESRGYSQEYMADCLHCSQSTYAHLESGKTAMRVDRLFDILKILDTDLHQLLQEDRKPDSTVPPLAGTQTDREIKSMYEKMIGEMKEEITFLRSWIEKERSNGSG